MEVEGSPYSLKRDHDSFEELADLEEPCSIPENYLEVLETQQIKQEEPASESLPTPPVSIGTKRDPSPARSTTGSLTDLGTATPHRGQSPMLGVPPASSATTSPSAFAALNGSAPPLKKTKLTFAEKEARRIEKEFKDRQKAEEKARKEAERQAHAEEKARKEAEKEAERKKREAEREEKRVAQEAEKAAKEEKRRKKEEEKQKAEEEKRKKERSQTKLGNFFSVPATRPRSGSVDSRGRSSISPAPSSALAAVASPAASTPSKPGQTPYEKTFLEFYIQNGVTLAPFSRFERDEEALESIQKTIDGYLSGNRSPTRRSFDPVFLFHLSSLTPRGKACMPVREIMSEFYSGNASKPIDLTTDSQNSQIKRTGDLLRKIPMKFLQFQEDVRPAYRGTYTSRPVTGMTKLARNPMRRDLPNTDYDYDSEAEWVEDEDAEDLKSEGDEEEEVDDDEDMDGFLDDENDETANSRRLVLQGDLQPVSTGLCWEDQKKRNTNVKLIPYRMEIILDPTIKSIDPFSKAYWEPIQAAMDPPRIPLIIMKNAVNANGSLNLTAKTVKPFFTTAADVLKTSSSTTPHSTLLPSQAHPPLSKPAKDSKPKKLLSSEDLPAFCAAVEGSDLSKVGLIEVLKKKFPGRPGAAIKATLETVAKRVGAKEVDKRWRLLDDGGQIPAGQTSENFPDDVIMLG